MTINRQFYRLITIISAGKLSLVLVGLLILFSICGALLPQEGLWTQENIENWQLTHPLATKIFQPLGLFHVFHSITFLICIILLSINTLTCTLLYIKKKGGLSWLKRPEALKNTGFIALHLSLLLLFAGGFWSSSTRMDGYIVLTEGQTFTETHENYLKLLEGPLRQENHQGFSVSLKKVKIKYQKNRYPLEIISELKFQGKNNQIVEGAVQVNKPYEFQGLHFTQDKTGFSPRLIIQKTSNGELMVNSYIALQTFSSQNGKEYRDYLPLPFFDSRVMLSLYPSFLKQENEYIKTGEEPDNPILLLETENEEEKKFEFQGAISLGEKIEIGDYSIEFTDLRYWSAFRVVEDHGYILIQIALWFGMAALLFRYIPDLFKWLIPVKNRS